MTMRVTPSRRVIAGLLRPAIGVTRTLITVSPFEVFHRCDPIGERSWPIGCVDEVDDEFPLAGR
jgi:hypothetical protein